MELEKVRLPKIPEDIRYEIRTFDRGEEILDGFSENENLFIVLEGSADVFYYSEEGDIMHIYRYKRGDIFGELELFGSNALPFSGQSRRKPHGSCDP